MTVQETSIECYYDADSQSKFESQRELIYFVVKNAKHPSMNDVQRITKLGINTVSGRMNELEKKGLIHKEATKIDAITKKRVNWYAVGPQ